MSAAEEVPDLSLRLCDDCGVVPEGVFQLKVAEQVDQAPGDITDARFVSCAFHFNTLTLNKDIAQALTCQVPRALTDGSMRSLHGGLQKPRMRLVRVKGARRSTVAGSSRNLLNPCSTGL